jgi:alpha-galactosidase
LNVAVQRLAVRGLLERDLDAVRQAIKLDPLTAATLTLPEIDRMIDDLLAANAEYLPEELTTDGR